MKKYFVLGAALLFCNFSQAAVYMIDFKCDQEAYKVFATMTLDELDGQFLEGSKRRQMAHARIRPRTQIRKRSSKRRALRRKGALPGRETAIRRGGRSGTKNPAVTMY